MTKVAPLSFFLFMEKSGLTMFSLWNKMGL